MIYMLTKFYEFISSETIFPILFGVPLFFLGQILYQKIQQKIKRKINHSIKMLQLENFKKTTSLILPKFGQHFPLARFRFSSVWTEIAAEATIASIRAGGIAICYTNTQVSRAGGKATCQANTRFCETLLRGTSPTSLLSFPT